MKKFPSFLFQASALALPIGFLVAGGCGGGNGVVIPPPVVLGTPTAAPAGTATPTPLPGATATATPGTSPTPDPGTSPTATPGTAPTPTATSISVPTPTSTFIGVPTPTATTNPNATPTPPSVIINPNITPTPFPGNTLTSSGDYTPNLNFIRSVASGSNVQGMALSLRATGLSSTIGIRTPASNGGFAQGQTFNATGAFAIPDTANGAVFYAEGSQRWDAVGGTVTLSLYTPGAVGTGQPGHLQFQLTNVQMVPSASTGATGTFILNGLLTARSGNTS